jgi:hypothetical protein
VQIQSSNSKCSRITTRTKLQISASWVLLSRDFLQYQYLPPTKISGAQWEYGNIPQVLVHRCANARSPTFMSSQEVVQLKYFLQLKNSLLLPVSAEERSHLGQVSSRLLLRRHILLSQRLFGRFEFPHCRDR